ncbi:MAG: extracellular solute-binding protein [Treponema sp.]|jgi:putative aldouronate transport system substrate-binding protein|nr:extracellular solute-binding protein [Treponema sp.]
MKKKMLAVLFLVALVFPLFAGGNRQQSGGSAGQTAGSNPVLTLTSMYYSAEVPETQALTAKMQEITGYRIDITWIPTGAYGDKFNTMLASDTLTHMAIPNDLKSSPYLNAVDDGLFWALNDYIKDYPNLVKIGDARYNNVKRNGNIMGIPRGRDLVRQGVIYRQDWAEDLGFRDQPETFEEIDRMVRGFAARPETRYGIVMGCAGTNPAVSYGVNFLAMFLGAPQNYGYNKAGQFTHAWLTDEYTRAVEQWRNWYADGLVNRNFIEITGEDAKKILNTEEAGLVFEYTDDIQNRFNDLYIKNPNARLWYAMRINSITFGTTGFNASIAISKTAVKDETLLRHCLSFIDGLGNPEWQTVIGIGLEGEHYTIVDGYAVQNDQQNAKYAATANQYGQVNCFQGIVMNPIPFKRIPAIEAMSDERLKYADTCVMDPTIPFVSPTAVMIGVSDLDPIRCDAINKYIMGTINKAEYQAAQRQWLDAGGVRVTREFEEQLRANR